MFQCYRYGKRLIRRIDTLAKEVCEFPLEGDVHALRVAIKQLNALVNMLAFYHNDLDGHCLKRMRKLFRAAGNMREWQLLDKYISMNQPGIEETSACTQQEIHKAYVKYRRIYKNTPTTYFDRTSRYLKTFCKKSSGLHFETYFNHLTEIIRKALRTESQLPEDYHKLRMLLKVLKYNYAAVNEFSKDAGMAIPDLRFLNEHDRILGKLHDLQAIVLQLTSLPDTCNISEVARAQVLQLKELTGRKAEALLNQYIHDMHQFLR